MRELNILLNIPLDVPVGIYIHRHVLSTTTIRLNMQEQARHREGMGVISECRPTANAYIRRQIMAKEKEKRPMGIRNDKGI